MSNMVQYFTEEEIKKFLGIGVLRNHRHRVWFRLLYALGLTITELIHLKVEDVCFKTRTIRVRTTRRNKERTLNFPYFLLIDLRTEIFGKEPKDYLFQGRDGMLHPRTVQKALEKTGKDLGVEASIRKFRKTLALHLLKCGWDEKGIAKMLGHSSPRATRKLMGADRIFFENRRHPLDRISRTFY
ncbi:MAG: tyrosine-type recombinase/integrase [Leptospiraceae bacterium]|nr:tyrosine-type recombinase/integrase [Leptospiraceae bacterium]